ncbi:MAG: beta-propeller fold lactonase family protein [Acidobacteriia bacterium]|nr:beta-propeller fold lactonase family protein [Terriglobia bacterium]
MNRYFAFPFVMICAAVLCSQPSRREQVGPQPDGSFLLSSGWRIKPVGTQVQLDTLPMSTALSKDGKYLLVLNGGYKPPSISVIDAATMNQVSSVPVADAWLGLAFSPDGTKVYAGGGSRATVYEFTFSGGDLKPAREFVVAPQETRKEEDFIGDVAVSPDGQRIYAAQLYRDTVVVINARTGGVLTRYKTGRRPYRILFHPDGKSIFVSSWTDGSVYLYDAANGNETGHIRLGQHTTDMVLSDKKPEGDADGDERYRLFVAAANTNDVFVVGVSASKQMKQVEAINVAMTPKHPLGMTPSAVSLSPDQSKLFIACSDANAVAVADISEARSRVMGFIPAGWYPTATRVLADGRILILNGRGLGSHANPDYAGPKQVSDTHGGDPRRWYVGVMQTGTMSVVPPLTDESLDEYTKSAQSLTRYKDSDLDPQSLPNDSVIVTRQDKHSPIEHVIYIVKENRTYDQVFGKIDKGNSDPKLCLFDGSAAPNHYKLAREFVLFDNFYVNSDVSADGHSWATASIAPDYVQKLWPNKYANRRKEYDFEGQEPANNPPAGYLWNNALAAGLTVRNYGYWVTNKKQIAPTGEVQIESVQDPALRSITNMKYRSFDLEYPDVDRAKVFLDDVKEWESTGKMPNLMIMRLGNDHTNGTTPGRPTPLALFADNDYALGLIVEGVSKSKFWSKTAIFVIEDDAQNGPDHVDSHRSPMLAISPYTHTAQTDSTMYNQSSVMRTMELILGMRPMTHYDAGARPLYTAFSSAPNPAPFTAEKPRISLMDKNPARSATAARSAQMDFDEADEIDDDELNDILWIAIKGTEPPAPVRSYFSAKH